jgi:RimJ/RimL family protein N-acetyltransferase
MQKIIDLKKDKKFIEQYVELRNKYTDLLLTDSVDISGTEEWLKKSNIEIRAIVEDDILHGVVILYLNRDAEVAFFAKEKSKGTGSKLLQIIEKVAKQKELPYIWAWVLEENLIAQRVFEKAGFKREGIDEREYKGLIRKGVNFRKMLSGE